MLGQPVEAHGLAVGARRHMVDGEGVGRGEDDGSARGAHLVDHQLEEMGRAKHREVLQQGVAFHLKVALHLRVGVGGELVVGAERVVDLHGTVAHEAFLEGNASLGRVVDVLADVGVACNIGKQRKEGVANTCGRVRPRAPLVAYGFVDLPKRCYLVCNVSHGEKVWIIDC